MKSFLFYSLVVLLQNFGNSLFEYDIETTEDQINFYYENDPIFPSGGTGKTKLWKNKTVYYDFQEPFYHKFYVNKAIEHIQLKTDIKFIQGQNSDMVLLTKNSGCSSSVGRITGVQTVNLYHTEDQRHCMTRGIIIHELLHVLGLWHEQSVYNRDEYIRVNYENIVSGTEHNFNKRNEVNNLNVGYDYSSIMHYSARAGSKNGWNTIDAINPDGTINEENTQLMGQRDTLTDLDALQIQLMYHCESGIKRLNELCSEDCPCKEGQGNCENDQDCEGDLVCHFNEGVYTYKITYFEPGLNVCKKTRPTVAPTMAPTYSKNTRKCIRHTELCEVKESLCERGIYNNKNYCNKLLANCRQKIDEWC